MFDDDVTFQRAELTAISRRYRRIRDCVEQKVKEGGVLYLPKPNPQDVSEANTLRYAAYSERAIFYGVTGRTLNGMIGQVFARNPEITVPELLKPLIEDVTGSGLSLIQLAKDTARETLALGRAGILVDYPTGAGVTTRAQQLAGEVRPTFTLYTAENIINWRTEKTGARNRLTLLVLRETVDEIGVFSLAPVTQYRVVQWTPFGCTVTVYRKDATLDVWLIRGERVELRDAAGKPLDEIPFSFIGSTNNDATVDEPPLYDLAELNIGHYRNSADYEEASFIVGQPTPWFSGLTQEWVDDVLQGEVLLGARAAVPLPAGAQAGLLQVSMNSMPMEAMKHKEAQMVALGARLVENRAVRRTLGEVKDSNASETSLLANVANNVSAAFVFALRVAARFVGTDTATVKFSLNTEFALTGMAAEERTALIADMQAGLITWSEARLALRRGGVASLDDDEAKAQIKLEKDQRDAAAAAQTAAGQRSQGQLELKGSVPAQK